MAAMAWRSVSGSKFPRANVALPYEPRPRKIAGDDRNPGRPVHDLARKTRPARRGSIGVGPPSADREAGSSGGTLKRKGFAVDSSGPAAGWAPGQEVQSEATSQCNPAALDSATSRDITRGPIIDFSVDSSA